MSEGTFALTQSKKPSRLPIWLVKILYFEYWPWQLFYIPLYPYLLFLSLKYRNAFAFSAINSSVSPDSGLLNASKSQILSRVSSEYKPKELLIGNPSSLTNVIGLLNSSNIDFPLICKPNSGERGNRVEVIHNESQLNAYLEHSKMPVIVQEYIEWEEEYGITFFKHPVTNEIEITSIGQKEFLHVIGNGKDDVYSLLNQSFRGRIYKDQIDQKYFEKSKFIPQKGSFFIVEPIGNHCRGTKFINRNDLIGSGNIHEKVKKVVEPLDEFHFGRIDLKTASESDLVSSDNPFKVFEINAVHAEPAHIYDPNTSLISAYRDLYKQWDKIFHYGSLCAKRGVPCLSLKRFITLVYQRQQNLHH